MRAYENIKIAVAGTGYVGLSLATLLSQNHRVTAVDIVPEKVSRASRSACAKISKYFSPLPSSTTITGCSLFVFNSSNNLINRSSGSYAGITIGILLHTLFHLRKLLLRICKTLLIHTEIILDLRLCTGWSNCHPCIIFKFIIKHI